MTSTFSPAFIEEMKQRLLADQVKVANELGLVASKNPNEANDLTVEFPDFGVEESDEAASAAEVAEYELNLNVEQDLKTLFRDIQRALKRIQDGIYGMCKYCKKAIPEERLRARPTSGSCIECKKTIVQEA
jgi:RNA polymerase-binding protein DksA